ncbi:MAG: ATP-binding domain-containing protein, partial [Helicobacter sp.]|nr:ATP-binding domain-containing protein [Helicobacter sp.]
LTPFRLQRMMILRACPQLRNKDKVFTIHRSQGLEFDTIIFSPVLLHYYLTDSRCIGALQALNVAVSRARKQIILVCDVAMWRTNKGQFLERLLQNAKPLKGAL